MGGPENTCLYCKKPQSELSKPLKRCAKCQKGHYCSRECQVAHWKTHKVSCTPDNNTPVAKPTSTPCPNPWVTSLKTSAVTPIYTPLLNRMPISNSLTATVCASKTTPTSPTNSAGFMRESHQSWTSVTSWISQRAGVDCCRNGGRRKRGMDARIWR